MNKITIRSKEYDVDVLSEELKLVAYDITKLTDEIDEAAYKMRTLSALREVLASKFEEEFNKLSGNSANSSDPLTGTN